MGEIQSGVNQILNTVAAGAYGINKTLEPSAEHASSAFKEAAGNAKNEADKIRKSEIGAATKAAESMASEITASLKAEEMSDKIADIESENRMMMSTGADESDLKSTKEFETAKAGYEKEAKEAKENRDSWKGFEESFKAMKDEQLAKAKQFELRTTHKQSIIDKIKLMRDAKKLDIYGQNENVKEKTARDIEINKAIEELQKTYGGNK